MGHEFLGQYPDAFQYYLGWLCGCGLREGLALWEESAEGWEYRGVLQGWSAVLGGCEGSGFLS